MDITASMKTALITGVRGQDGFYLAEQLLVKGYQVIGTTHASDLPRTIDPSVHLVSLDLRDTAAVKRLVAETQPDEIYNLAARSSSAQLFDDPLATAEVNGLAATRFLEAIRESAPQARYLQAASSEMFAGCRASPQDESTPYSPINAYGAAKTYATHMVSAYRERHGLFAATAILFNHESPRRGLHYVTRKITHAVARIALGRSGELVLGDLDSRRDWGFAGDYAQAMWLMLQQPQAQDYVIATGVTHSVREFCDVAFSHVGLDYRDFVRSDAQWARHAETIERRGNPARAMRQLNWLPSVGFNDLVRMMVDADLAQLKAGNA